MVPGSDIKSFKIVEKEAALMEPYFDSDEEEGPPVDMQEVFEAMKYVPLPDIEYPDQEEPLSMDHSAEEPLSGTAVRPPSNGTVPQNVLKRKGGTGEAGQPIKKGGGTGRVSKRYKVEVQSSVVRSRASPQQSPKVKVVASSTAVAAKVAAEVAPNVVTGGTVTENGPPPDFSLWTAEDDLLLKTAMEAGASMEALGKGAMPFSSRFTIKEFRARWRAILYAESDEVAIRMAAVDCSRPKAPVDGKGSLELALKRKANSVRSLYYKKMKKVPQGDDPISSHGLGGFAVEGVEVSEGKLGNVSYLDPVCKPPLDASPMGVICSDALTPKEATQVDIEERTAQDGSASQMFTLLAVGGVQAVVEQDKVCDAVDVQRQVHDCPSTGALQDSGQEGGTIGQEHGPLIKQSGSRFAVAVAVESTKPLSANCTAMQLCLPKSKFPEVNPNDSSHFIEEDIQFTSANRGRPSEQSSQGCLCTTFDPIHNCSVGDFKGQCTGLCYNFSNQEAATLGFSPLDTPWETGVTAGTDEVENLVGLTTCSTAACATTLLSPADERERPNGTVKCSCDGEAADAARFGLTDSRKVVQASACFTMDDDRGVTGMDVAERVDDIYSDCDCDFACGEHCSPTESSDDSVLDGAGREADQDRDGCAPSELNRERCAVKFDPVYGLSKSAKSMLGPYVCQLNTECMDIPDLEGALLASPSVPSSPSEQGEYVTCTDGAMQDAEIEDYPDMSDGDVDGNACGDITDDLPTCLTKLGHSVETNGGKCVQKNAFNNVECDSVSLAVPVRERKGSKNEHLFTQPVLENTSLPLLPKVEDLHLQVVSQVDISSLKTNSARFCDAHTPTGASMALGVKSNYGQGQNVGETAYGQLESSPRRLLPTVSELDFAIEEAHRLELELAMEEPDSEDELATFSDVEAMILENDLDFADDAFSARAESRRMYRRHGRQIVRGEQAACAGMQRELNSRGAFAILYGKQLRYFVDQTEVLMGRATSDNAVDLDLGREGRANKVSRQQANIKLKEDGNFYLRNLGRRGVTVNNNSVETGQRAILQPLCLVEVGGIRFVFEPNKKLVKEHTARTTKRA